MAGAPRKKRGRPPTGIRRPVITLRVHEDIYETIKRTAERGKLTLSEEAARRIGVSVALDKQKLELEDLKRLGVEQFLHTQGYTKVRDLDDNELWAKGAGAVAKYMAFSPELETIIERMAERVVERILQKEKQP
jgi:hypothetical protein